MTTAAGAEVAGGSGTGTRRGLDVGLGGRARRAPTVDDRRRCRSARRPASSAPVGALPLSRSRAPPPSPRRSARTATARPTLRRVTYRIDGGRERHGRGDRCARRGRGDRGRPRVDAGRRALGDRRRCGARRRRVQRADHGADGGRRDRSERRAASRQSHARSRGDAAGRVLTERRRSQGPPHADLHAGGTRRGGRSASSATAAGSPRRSTALRAGTQRLVWDGTRVAGTLRDGEYRAVVEATNELGVISYGVPFVVGHRRAARSRSSPGSAWPSR